MSNKVSGQSFFRDFSKTSGQKKPLCLFAFKTFKKECRGFFVAQISTFPVRGAKCENSNVNFERIFFACKVLIYKAKFLPLH